MNRKNVRLVVLNSTEHQEQNIAAENAESPVIVSKNEAKEKGLKYYFTGKACKRGHAAGRTTCSGNCTECIRILPKVKYKYTLSEKQKRDQAEKRSKHRKNNKEHVRLKEREYYRKNKESIRKRKNKWVSENSSKNKKLKLESYYRNKDKTLKTSKEWKDRNPLNTFTRRTIYRIENGFNTAKYEVTLGYTQSEFIKHIESLFTDGMSWNNRSEWHIDHIKPISLFIKEGVTDIKVINALSNLRPLWAKENISKGSKYND